LGTFYTPPNFSAPAGFIPATGGPFTFDNGSGGSDVGHFTKTLDMPAPIVWTNQTNITAVNRGQGVTVTWSGGAPGTFVTITGSSAATVNGRNLSTAFTCQAPVSALSFTVPSHVLL